MPLVEEENYYKEMLRVDPGCVSALNNLGWVYLKSDNFQEAELVFTKAKDLGSPYATHYLGYLFHLKGNSELAGQYYREAESVGIKTSIYTLGTIEEEKNNFQEAIKRYEHNQYSCCYSIYSLGILKQEQGYLEESKKLFKRNKHVSHIPSLLSLSFLYAMRRCERRAKKHFDSAFNLFMKNRGRNKPYLMEAKRYLQLPHRADNAFAIANLGLCFRLELRYDQAEACFLRVSQSNDAPAIFALAILHECMDKFSRALLFYQQASALDYPRAHYKLAEFYAAGKGVQKSLAEASIYYRKAAEQGHQNSQKALKNLPLIQETPIVQYNRALACRNEEEFLQLCRTHLSGLMMLINVDSDLYQVKENPTLIWLLNILIRDSLTFYADAITQERSDDFDPKEIISYNVLTCILEKLDFNASKNAHIHSQLLEDENHLVSVVDWLCHEAFNLFRRNPVSALDLEEVVIEEPEENEHACFFKNGVEASNFVRQRVRY